MAGALAGRRGVNDLWDDILVSKLGGDTLHLVPVDDAVEHELATDCVCGPAVDILGESDLLVAHWALDGRPS